MTPKELHKIHNNVVEINRIDNINGIKTEYPRSILYDSLDKLVVTYQLVSDSLIIYYKGGDGVVSQNEIAIPPHYHRISVVTDIIMSTLERNINTNLIHCVQTDETVGDGHDIIALMDKPEDKKEQKLERDLSSLFYDVFAGNDVMAKAKKMGVAEGYVFMKDIIASKGLINVNR